MKKKKVFNSYKSFEITSHKHKSKVLIFFLIFLVYAGYNFVTKPRKAFKSKHPEAVESVGSAYASKDINLSPRVPLEISKEFHYSGCVKVLKPIGHAYFLDKEKSKFYIEKNNQTFTFDVFFPSYQLLASDSQSLTIVDNNHNKIIFLTHSKSDVPAGSASEVRRLDTGRQEYYE